MGQLTHYPNPAIGLAHVDALFLDENAFILGLICCFVFYSAPKETVMPGSDGKPSRPWQEIAAEASREENTKRLLELTTELELALDERDKQLRECRNSLTKTASP